NRRSERLLGFAARQAFLQAQKRCPRSYPTPERDAKRPRYFARMEELLAKSWRCCERNLPPRNASAAMDIGADAACAWIDNDSTGQQLHRATQEKSQQQPHRQTPGR